ncbi:dynein axonemal intermediate chain 3 [Chanos chanos]|uniref:Dynein axonemal intermediate chain 3 n=1 Tax=Chanos chanos TaxID=29144 RepID=A0A6J2VA63_CHACN|nr:WD repeat-containing protein 63 [Chanos chanos]
MSSEKQERTRSSMDGESKDHPEDIFPLALTSVTQEMFECRADQEVTGDKPYKLLRKDDIVKDLRVRLAVSDFSPVKQIVLNYPEAELLLVYDRDFTYGHNFYLVITVSAKEKILNPQILAEGDKAEDKSSETLVQRASEPHPWVSLGSEREVGEEAVRDSRHKAKYKISRLRREFGTKVCFSDRNSTAEGKYVECPSYQDKRFCIKMLERDIGAQAVADLKTCFTQTLWKYPKSACTQYEPREYTKEEKANFLNLENLETFVKSATSRFEVAIQQNEIMDVFINDLESLSEEEQEEQDDGDKADTDLRVYTSFIEHFCKEKSISHFNWHPTINGVIAVAVTERLSVEERIENSTKLLLNPSFIVFWSFSDTINPLLLLESPADVSAFEFCPSKPNIIVGGCMNGQLVLWDISGQLERLDGGGGKSTLSNRSDTLGFKDKQENETPVLRYCAVSSIESGHKGPITDVQWLPESFEISRTGIPVENRNGMCVQIVTCAPTCCVMFWDIRAPETTQTSSEKRLKEKIKCVENLHGLLNTFRHLDLSWKPILQVHFPKTDSRTEYSPLKISLRESTWSNPLDRALAGTDRSEIPEYSLIRLPSAKHLKPLEDISTKFYIGTEDGELVYTDWRMEEESDSGCLHSVKTSQSFVVHDSQVNTVQRSPFFTDIILTVGGWTFAVWRESIMIDPVIISPCSQERYTAGHWSLTKPGLLFVGREDGDIEVWDLLEKTHEPSKTWNITTSPITCIKPWIVSGKQHLLAVTDQLGHVQILEIPWICRNPSPNEKLRVSELLEKEVERLIYFERRKEMRSKEKEEREAEKHQKTVEPIMLERQVEQIEEEGQKEYEGYLMFERAILKKMGLLQDTVDI